MERHLLRFIVNMRGQTILDYTAEGLQYKVHEFEMFQSSCQSACNVGSQSMVRNKITNVE